MILIMLIHLFLNVQVILNLDKKKRKKIIEIKIKLDMIQATVQVILLDLMIIYVNKVIFQYLLNR